jgi:hypothetical protein
MADLALEIAGKTLLGVDTRTEAARIASTLEVFMQYFERQLRSWEGLLPQRIPTPSRLAMRRAIEDLDGIVYEMVTQCRRSGPGAGHGSIG